MSLKYNKWEIAFRKITRGKLSRKLFFSVKMRSSTWSRDSHGLYDYEGNNMTLTDLTITWPCKLIRKGSCVETREIKEDLDKTVGGVTKGLAYVGKINGTFWVFDPSVKSPNATQEQLWLVMKNQEIETNPGYKLQVNDVIKFGRTEYIIKEVANNALAPAEIKVEILKENSSPVVLKPEPTTNKQSINATIVADKVSRQATIVEQEDEKDKAIEASTVQQTTIKEEENQCRVCLRKESTPENILISSPCKCTGSIQYIHAICLQQWLKSKVTETKLPCTTSYSWKPFECDVCKAKYPGKLK